MAQAWATITAYHTTTPTIHSGSGNFSVIRVDTGIYLIDFKDGTFTGTPALVATQQHGGGGSWTDFASAGSSTRDNVVILALDKDHAKLKTGDDNGKASDRNFSFIAMGN